MTLYDEENRMDEVSVIVGLLFFNTRDLLNEIHQILNEDDFYFNDMKELYIFICNSMDELGYLNLKFPVILDFINHIQKNSPCIVNTLTIEEFLKVAKRVGNRRVLKVTGEFVAQADFDYKDEGKVKKTFAEVEVDKIFEFSKSLSAFMSNSEYFGGLDYSLYARVMSDCYRLQASIDDWEIHIDI